LMRHIQAVNQEFLRDSGFILARGILEIWVLWNAISCLLKPLWSPYNVYSKSCTLLASKRLHAYECDETEIHFRTQVPLLWTSQSMWFFVLFTWVVTEKMSELKDSGMSIIVQQYSPDEKIHGFLMILHDSPWFSRFPYLSKHSKYFILERLTHNFPFVKLASLPTHPVLPSLSKYRIMLFVKFPWY
jgi:hypothetical protein